MKRMLLVSMLVGLLAPVFGQDTGSVTSYVSRLRTAVDGSYIKLLWKDSDLKGASYIVYRATQELTAQDFSSAAKIATVPGGQESYVDTPPDTQGYFYAVLAQDQSGKLYDIFIPFRNTTTESSAVAVAASDAGQFAQVEGLQAKVTGGSVQLTFTAARADRELIVYRNTSPIRASNDLLNATKVGLIPSSQVQFQDSPIAGIPYYYAVIDAEMLKTGVVNLTAGKNSTKDEIDIPLNPNAIGGGEFATKRPRPLPFLLMSAELQSGGSLGVSPELPTASEAPLSQASQIALDSLLGGEPNQAAPALSPVILDVDKAATPETSGDEYALSMILNGPFAVRAWDKTEAALADYFNVQRAQAFEERAHFYLGQAYYFQGDLTRAFLEFLLVQDSYYAAVQPWIDSIFEKLHDQTTAAAAPASGAGTGPNVPASPASSS